VRRLALLAIVTAAALAAPAAAVPPNAADRGCSVVILADVSPEAPPSSRTGLMWGGPIRQNGTLTCTVKVDVATHNGAYVNGVSRSVTGTNGVTALSPGASAFLAPPGQAAYLCSQFTDSLGVTYYWDGDLDRWTTSSAVRCEATGPIGADTGTLARTVVDPVLCPVLAALSPYLYPTDPVYPDPQGDLYVLGGKVYDCPPYDSAQPDSVLVGYVDLPAAR